MRVKRGASAHKRRKNVIRRAKGFIHGRSKMFRLAKEALLKAGVYAFRDRRAKKRDFRTLWNVRINAAARENGMTYSQFINALKQSKSTLNRKVLQELAQSNAGVFKKIVETVKK